jgi:DNA (cytosine-5)-methyltransferase 1
MKDEQKFRDLLDKVLDEAKQHYKNGSWKNFLDNNLSKEQVEYIGTITENLESQKSVFAVIVTSLIKKIEDPNQDIRLHRASLNLNNKKGYCGRCLDTNVVTPWLKEHFSRFAPKESGWLTRSIEQDHGFTKDFPGKIRNEKVKTAFLSILDDVEEKKVSAENYLIGLFILVLNKTNKETETTEKLTKVQYDESISIDQILKMLEEHFSIGQSSRLPVIAIYSIYQILSKNVEIYKDKNLQQLKPHTTSDKYTGYGDIEVYYSNGNPFEIVEIKHKISIDLTVIQDGLKKIQGTTIKRYFILTTAEPNFKGDEKEIFNFLNNVKRNYNIDIIPNGILSSLKYYLRFLPNLIEFVNKYTENLRREFQQTTDVKESHVEKWEEIIEKYGLCKNR